MEIPYQKGKWSKSEDEFLSSLASKYSQKNWKTISQQLKTRSPLQCLHRWSKVLRPGLKKGPWSPTEDEKLLEWVAKNGAKQWSQCAIFMKGRSGKQCRERWTNVLNPELKKGDWTNEEDKLIYSLYKELGSHWSEISKQLTGRTENAVKNRFYSAIRKNKGDLTSILRENCNYDGECVKKKIKKEDNENNFSTKISENKTNSLDVLDSGVEEFQKKIMEFCNETFSHVNDIEDKKGNINGLKIEKNDETIDHLYKKLNLLESLLSTTKYELNKIENSFSLNNNENVFDLNEDEKLINISDNISKQIDLINYESFFKQKSNDASPKEGLYVKTNNIIIAPSKPFY